MYIYIYICIVCMCACLEVCLVMYIYIYMICVSYKSHIVCLTFDLEVLGNGLEVFGMCVCGS